MNKELDFLVVEDDVTDAKAISFLLQHSELARHIETCTTLRQAKQRAALRHFDAVILDLGLPDCQGVDGLIEFKAAAPDLPIVVLTGSLSEETALRSLNIGAEDVMDKSSVDSQQFSRTLLYAIKRHSHLRRLYLDKIQLGKSLDEAMQCVASEKQSD